MASFRRKLGLENEPIRPTQKPKTELGRAMKNNAPGRVEQVLSRMGRYQANARASQNWAAVFGIVESNDAARNRRVTHLLGLMYDELDCTKKGLAALRWEEEAYLPEIEAVQGALTGYALDKAWETICAHVAPHRRHLVAMSQVLPEDGPLLDATALAEIASEVAALRRRVEEAALPQEITRFLLQQLDLMQRALTEYEIRGSAAFADAAQAAQGEWIQHGEVVREARAEPIVREVQSTWTRLGAKFDKYAARFLVLEKVIEAAVKGVGALHAAPEVLEVVPCIEQPAPQLPAGGTRLADG